MPKDQAERIIESGFESLTSAVIVEATGTGPRSFGAVLGSKEYCETWLTALIHVRANLSHAMGLRLLQAVNGTEDSLFQKHSRTRDRVSDRLPQAQRRVEAVRAELDAKMDALLPKRSVPVGGEEVLEAHEEEYRALIAETAEETDVAAAVFDPPPNAEQDPVWAEKIGLIKEMKTDAVREMLWASDDEMRDRTADDVRAPGGRHPALRHPLVLPRWGMALRQLTEMTGRALNLDASEPVPDSEWLREPVDIDQARTRLGRLRFFEAVRTRSVEHAALMHEISRHIRYEMTRRRLNVEARAREKLLARYADEVAMYAAFTA